MLSTKDIIVVAPEDYKNLARRLTHAISKVPGCNGAFWNIKQYEDNEFQLGGKRYLILIGNQAENRITADFLPVIKTLNNQAGACYGFDGPKAVVFGEGKLEQEGEFKEVRKSSKEIADAGVTGACGALAFFAISPIFLINILLGTGQYFLLKYLSQKQRERKLRTEQTEAALILFLAKHFDAWVGLEK